MLNLSRTQRLLIRNALAGLLALGTACDRGDDERCIHTPALSWENFGKGFMEENCTGCHSIYLTGEERHGAPEGVDLNTYADVVFWVERVDIRATGDDADMPPGGSVSVEDRTRLEEWLSCEVYPDAQALEEDVQ